MATIEATEAVAAAAGVVATPAAQATTVVVETTTATPSPAIAVDEEETVITTAEQVFEALQHPQQQKAATAALSALSSPLEGEEGMIEELVIAIASLVHLATPPSRAVLLAATAAIVALATRHGKALVAATLLPRLARTAATLRTHKTAMQCWKWAMLVVSPEEYSVSSLSTISDALFVLHSDPTADSRSVEHRCHAVALFRKAVTPAMCESLLSSATPSLAGLASSILIKSSGSSASQLCALCDRSVFDVPVGGHAGASVMWCFGPTVAALPAAEVAKLLQSATRMVRRGPAEQWLPVLRELLRHTQLADPALAKSFDESALTVLLEPLRAEDLTLQQQARDTLLVAASKTPEIVIERMCKALSGGEGIMAYVYQRTGIFSALLMALQSCSSAAVLESVVSRAVAYEKKETNAEVRVACYRVLGHCLAKLPSIPKDAAELLTDARLTDKDPVMTAQCACIADAVATMDAGKVPHLPKLALVLSKVAQAQCTKVAQVASAALVHATRGLLLMGTPGTEKLFEYGAPLAVSSTLFNPAYLAKVSAASVIDCKGLAQLAVVAGTVRSALVNGLSEAHRFLIFNLLCTALSSSEAEARRYALSLCEQNVASAPALFSNLTLAAAHRVHLLPEPTLPAPKKGQAPNNNTSFPAVPIHPDVVLAASNTNTPAESLPILFVLAHHPSMQVSGETVMHSMARKILPAAKSEAPVKLITANGPAILSFLESEHCLASRTIASAQAAVAAMRTVAHVVPSDSSIITPTAEMLLRSLTANIRKFSSGLNRRTENIFFAEGDEVVYTADERAKLEEEEDALNKKSSAIKLQKETKKRGDSRMYKVDEEIWDQKMRLQKEEEKLQTEAQQHRNEQLKQKLAEQEQIRQKIREDRLPVVNALQALSAVFTANKAAFIPHLAVVCPALIKALGRTPILAYAVQDCIVEVFKCNPAPLPRLAWMPLSACICDIYVDQSEEIPNIPDETVVSLTSVLHEISELRSLPMPGSAYALVFPLVRAVLLQPHSVPMQRPQASAMKLICTHTTPGPSYPRSQIISVLISVIESAPRFISRARAAMHAVLEGVALCDLSVVMEGVVNPDENVREACITAIRGCPLLTTFPADPSVMYPLWISRFDIDSVASVANEVWTIYNHPITVEFFGHMKKYLTSSADVIRELAARAIAGALDLHPTMANDTLTNMVKMFRASLPANRKNVAAAAASAVAVVGAPEVAEEPVSNKSCRTGSLKGIGACARHCSSPEMLKYVFDFLLSEPLQLDEDIRALAVKSGTSIIEQQGNQCHTFLFPHLESHINRAATIKNLSQRDRVKESCVLYMASLARSAEVNPERTDRLIANLRPMLSSPSELVQQATASCFTCIAAIATPEQQEALVKSLLDTITSVNKDNNRRGAAYALSGLVKGLGLMSLKKFNIMATLTEAVDESKKGPTRQGGLFAFELLSQTLGRLFEPYVIQILPKLLACYGDSAGEIREATNAAARSIMAQMSAHGLKLVLPALLKATDDSSWRTKKSGIELLASMAFCSPQQLSACLPQIVPTLIPLLNDTHREVHAAARDALHRIGSVIRNPEIMTISSEMIKALDDPSDRNTRSALEALESTDFVHAIDPPSLSLILPVVIRGLRESSSETKRKAAQIVGNICSLTDPKDVVPYMKDLLIQLEVILVDPSPDVRATTAKALGSLIKGVGEQHFSELIPWLMQTMHSDKGPVERAGAAQGLSEVLSGLDRQRLDTILPSLFQHVTDPSPSVKEGTLCLFRFLPTSLGNRFVHHISAVLRSAFICTADDMEPVRDTALRACNTIVNAYWETSIQLIQPVLLDCMMDESWRVQEASLLCLNDIFNKAMSTDPATASRDSSRVVIRVLGEDVTKAFLTSLYVLRFDTSAVVSQRAIVIWKSVVTNPPRMLQEIFPIFMTLLVSCLSSSSAHRQVVASRALGDLVERLASKVLPAVIPVLEKGLDQKDDNMRQGVCIGLAELIRAAGREHLTTYLSVVLPAVQKALSDESALVRSVACTLLDNLCKTMSNKIIDDLLTNFVRLVHVECRKDSALRGMTQVVQVRCRFALRTLVPVFAKVPIHEFEANALVELCQVADDSLEAHIGTIVERFLDTIDKEPETGRQYLQRFALALPAASRQSFLSQLSAVFADEDCTDEHRIEALNALCSFLQAAKMAMDASDFDIELLTQLVTLLNNPSEVIQKAALQTIDCIVKSTRKDSFPKFIPEIRKTLTQIESETMSYVPPPQRTIPGFCLPMGLAPLLPIFLTSLMNVAVAEASREDGATGYVNPNEIREQAAAGLGDLVRLTTPQALTPFIVGIAGPLIRIVGDRFPADVKLAILTTLSVLLDKCDAKLKTFFPQLQSAFVKAVRDSNRNVRAIASELLGKLVALGSRVDPLLNELISGLSGESDVLESLLGAVFSVLSKTATPPDAQILLKAGPAVLAFMNSVEDSHRTLASDSYAYHLKHLGAAAASAQVTGNMIFAKDSLIRWQQRQSRCRMAGTLAVCGPAVYASLAPLLNAFIAEDLTSETVAVRVSALWAVGRTLGIPSLAQDTSSAFMPRILEGINEQAVDAAIESIRSAGRFCKRCPDLARPHARMLADYLQVRNKISTAPVKLTIAKALDRMRPLL